MEDIKKLLIAAGILTLSYFFLVLAHRQRRLSRTFIYHHLYGPSLFMLVLIPITLQFALSWRELTVVDALLMILAVPLFIQLIVSLAMVVRLFFNKADYKNPELHELETYPKVAIILPTYNEPFEIAKMTLDSLIDMEYEGDWKVVVVDNSKEHEDLALWKNYVEELGEIFHGSNLAVEWISRDPELKGYKPLNLDVAYERFVARDWEVEYVMYVDTDSTFHVNTLTDLVKTFAADEDAAYIQLMTVANNMDVNGLSKAVGMQQTIFRYVLGEIGNWGMPIFYGHNAIYKRAIIAQLGSFLETDSRGEYVLTEDFSMTIRSYLKGSYGKPHWVLSGEGVPTSLAALKGMWDRWAVGGLQVLFKYFRQVILSDKINFYEKASFLFHGMCYPSQALIPIMVLISPLMPEFAWFSMALVITNSIVSAVGFKKKFAPLIPETKENKPGVISYFLSFFAVNSYIIWVMFLATWKFMYRLAVPKKYREKLTWVVTPKGKEEEMKWSEVLRNNASIIVFVSLFLVIAAYFLMYGPSGAGNWLVLIPGGLFSLNLALTLLTFGRSRKVSSKPSVKPPNIRDAEEVFIVD